MVLFAHIVELQLGQISKLVWCPVAINRVQSSWVPIKCLGGRSRTSMVVGLGCVSALLSIRVDAN